VSTGHVCYYCSRTLSGLRPDGTVPRHNAPSGGTCIGGGFAPPLTAKEIIGEARARVRQSRLGTTGAEVEKRARKGKPE